MDESYMKGNLELLEMGLVIEYTDLLIVQQIIIGCFILQNGATMLNGSLIKHIPISKLTTRSLTLGMIRDLIIECN